MSCNISCPYWEGHECLIVESKPTLSEFRLWLAENVGEDVESTETLLGIYSHFTLSCLRCPHNPHHRTASRITVDVDENLRRFRQAHRELAVESASG